MRLTAGWVIMRQLGINIDGCVIKPSLAESMLSRASATSEKAARASAVPGFSCTGQAIVAPAARTARERADMHAVDIRAMDEELLPISMTVSDMLDVYGWHAKHHIGSSGIWMPMRQAT